MTTRFDELIDPAAELERLAGDFGLIEGPIWMENTLFFNDIPASKRYAWSEQDGLTLLSESTNKGNGMDFDEQGRVFVCEHTTSTVTRFDGPRSTESTVVASHYEGRALNSPNDVVYGPDRHIYLTDPPYGRTNEWVGLIRDRELDFAGVFRADPEGDPRDLTLVSADFTGPNGLCFSPDGSILYVNDTPRKNVRAFTLDDKGVAVADRVLVDFSDEEGEGGVDGMECDEHGNVWVTGPRGVWAISPEGEKLGVIPIPGPPDRALSLVWGGAEGRDLFITAWSTLYRIPTLVRGYRPIDR